MQRHFCLPLTEAKCIAPKCKRSTSCARHLIPGEQGRAIADFSLGVLWFAEACAGFYAMERAYANAEKKPARKVHAPISERSDV